MRLIALIAVLLVLTACSSLVETTPTGAAGELPAVPEPQPSALAQPDLNELAQPATETTTEATTEPATTEAITEPAAAATPNIAPERFTITKTEGERIVLHPQAIDPDGDEVHYSFTEPFAADGTWQTRIGDAGSYDVTITATDTHGAAAEVTITVIVLPANQPPHLNCPELIVVREGEDVIIDCEVSDPEGDEVAVSYDGWMDGPTRSTGYDDAGSYTVTVTAADEHGQSEATVVVKVEDVNRAPEFPLAFPTTLSAKEGDVVRIDASGVTDPDGDKVTVSFSEPFNERGVWHTHMGDAGQYTVEVVATDGTASTTRRVGVDIAMVNTPPELQPIDDITVTEGETIRLPLAATDRENDELSFTISGWMDSAEYTTTFEDAGEYTVRIEVSDGELSDSEIVHITVLNKNRPPVFRVPA